MSFAQAGCFQPTETEDFSSGHLSSQRENARHLPILAPSDLQKRFAAETVAVRSHYPDNLNAVAAFDNLVCVQITPSKSKMAP